MKRLAHIVVGSKLESDNSVDRIFSSTDDYDSASPARMQFAQQIESLGSNTIWVLKFDPSFGRQPSTEELHRKELTIEDADAIRNESPSVSGVAPFYRKIAETVSTMVITGRRINGSEKFTSESLHQQQRQVWRPASPRARRSAA